VVDGTYRQHRVHRVLLAAIEIERTTVLLVTHDRADALRMGHRVALLRDGTLEQIGTAREMYRLPRTEYAAHFFGPGLVWEGVATHHASAVVIKTPLGTVTLPQQEPGPVRLLIRPEALSLCNAAGTPAVVVGRPSYEGSRCRITVETSGIRAPMDVPAAGDLRSGDRIHVRVDADLLVVLPSA
jgi:ABC-type Fe3+/spermidine/putrescine transport system ATPase subunit